MVQCLSFLKKMRVGGENIFDIVLCNNDRYDCWSRSERRLTQTARRNLIQFKTVKSQIEFLTTLTFQWKRTFHIQTFKCMNKHAIFVCGVLWHKYSRGNYPIHGKTGKFIPTLVMNSPNFNSSKEFEVLKSIILILFIWQKLCHRGEKLWGHTTKWIKRYLGHGSKQ